MADLRIMLVDDHPLIREALRNAVESEGGMEVVGEASNGQLAIKIVGKLMPDVVVMDLYMPVMDGLATTRELLKENPDLKVLVVTSSNEDDKVLEAIRAGAKGYMLKDSSREQILDGIRVVASGQRYIPPEIAEKMVNALKFQDRTTLLTSREKEIFLLVGQGLSNHEIAEKLVISETTTRVHIGNIIDKMKLATRRDLERMAAQKPGP